MNPADLERMMEVNLYGTLHAMQAVIPSMRAQSRGNIVDIASLAGRPERRRLAATALPSLR